VRVLGRPGSERNDENLYLSRIKDVEYHRPTDWARRQDILGSARARGALRRSDLVSGQGRSDSAGGVRRPQGERLERLLFSCGKKSWQAPNRMESMRSTPERLQLGAYIFWR
jgi:hypothetical protein